MKRTAFLVVALFALMAVGVYAQTEADFGVNKSADGKSITIDEYKGSATTVNIPSKIQNLPVTKIGEQAFWVTSPITSVTIPNTVTSIERGAFTSASLTSVTFQGTIPASGFHAGAFGSGMTSLGDIRDKYLAAGGGAGTYTRPDTNSNTWTKSASATAAPTSATKLEFALNSDGKGYKVSKGTGADGDVVIPASYNNLPVTEIAISAFDSSRSIKSVIIPDSVTKIGAMAFNNCVFIKSVTIGSGVKEIGKNAFASCASLNSVTFGGANTVFGVTEFPEGSDLRTKYKAGGEGTYTLSGKTWTKK